MTENPLSNPTTAFLIEHLQSAVDYEAAMERDVAPGQALRPFPFMPAAKVGYQRMLATLQKPALSPSDLNLIHAEYLGILEQPHYHGAQLWFVSMLLDEWLACTSPEHWRSPWTRSPAAPSCWARLHRRGLPGATGSRLPEQRPPAHHPSEYVHIAGKDKRAWASAVSRSCPLMVQHEPPTSSARLRPPTPSRRLQRTSAARTPSSSRAAAACRSKRCSRNRFLGALGTGSSTTTNHGNRGHLHDRLPLPAPAAPGS